MPFREDFKFEEVVPSTVTVETVPPPPVSLPTSSPSIPIQQTRKHMNNHLLDYDYASPRSITSSSVKSSSPDDSMRSLDNDTLDVISRGIRDRKATSRKNRSPLHKFRGISKVCDEYAELFY